MLKLEDIIKQNFTEEEIIDLTRLLVECPSHLGIENQETAVANTIYDFFRKEGIPADLIHIADGRCNVVARLKGRGGGKTLLLCGHTDTVPPYDMQDPYELKIRDGSMFGRGVNDMKGQVACMITSMAAIKRANIELAGDIIFAGVIDEEAKSLGARALLKSGLSVDAAIVGEGTDMQIYTSQKGLEWLQFNFHGKTVHGGKQKEGINAIEKAAKFIARVEQELLLKIESRTHPNFKVPSSMNYGMIKGGTQPSTVAGDCILQIDRRWVQGEKYEEILSEYQEVLDQLACEDPQFKADFEVMDISYMEDGFIHEVMNTDTDEEIVKISEQVIKSVLGKEAKPATMPAWTDGGLINTYGKIPTIILGPGFIENAHSAQEHLETDSLIPAVTVYSLIACQYCK